MKDWAGSAVQEDGKYKCKICEQVFDLIKGETYPICPNCGNYSWVKT